MIFSANYEPGTAEILEKLLKKPETTLMAYQIGFDLYESATQQFLTSVRNSMKLVSAPPATITDAAPIADAAATDAADTESMETDDAAPDTVAAAPKEGTPNGTTATTTTTAAAAAAVPTTETSAELKKLAGILSGDTTISLHLQFLIRNNHTDLLVLKKTKETVRRQEKRNV